MKKNKLINLNDHLFEQLERLNDDDLTDDDLDREIKRAQAMNACAAQIVNNAALALKAYAAINTGMIDSAPEMLGIKKAEALEDRPHD
ncbi:hypothetical protein [Desulfobacter sp.]|uniref:hypothetical protein n=1 Tax=Desulfobacter sp. TaxID=2294 RepID=UPI003D0FC3C9